ncbi:MAG: hypothetical protein JOZ05_19670, partial [Acetobacteraceae bacterium]|nr:hypothetical protein [Acetobacteraceae bacterium]
LAGGAALLALGTAAVAADKLHRMQVALPDGSVAQIEYAGNVAPKVVVQPADAATLAAFDPFAGFDQIAAQLEAQQQAMMRQMVAMQQAAAQAANAAPGQTLVANMPAGVHYSYVSTTTDANGCTRTVQYSSDGSSAQPQVTQASSGNCDSVKPSGPVPAAAKAPSTDEGLGEKV